MDDVKTFLGKSLVNSEAGQPLVTVAHLLAVAVGSVGLYFMIPERKRKNLFK